MEKDPVIGLIIATMLEASPFVEGMALKQSEEVPFAVYQKDNIVLIISGIGKANAAMASAYCCQVLNPAWICNLGAAGATDYSCTLGEVYHVTEAIEYDRPEFESRRPHVHIPHILEGFRTTKVATHDTAVIDPERRREIALYAGLVDMEAASVIQACSKFETRCIIFKFVSDTPDHTNDAEIVEHIRRYRTSFYKLFYDSVLPLLL